VWNQFDFAQPHIGESTPNLNKKGLLTFDRRTKDVYYLYQANWTTRPMVYVASRDWAHRAGVGDAAVTQPVDVYTNLDRVELFANGKSLGARTPDDVRKATWQVPFVDGDNAIEARATGSGSRGDTVVVDRMTIRFDRVPADLAAAPFRELAVNVGSNAQYADDDGTVWLPDQPYRKGGFGYVGGERALMAREVIVTNSRRTPLLVTYRANIEGYRLDVPDGDYEVELQFAGTGGAAGATAPGGAIPGPGGTYVRVFAVAVNGAAAAERVDLTTRGNVAPAVPVTVRATASGGAGLTITFRPIEGQPILNGIRVRKR
jgi:beta-galactosidase